MSKNSKSKEKLLYWVTWYTGVQGYHSLTSYVIAPNKEEALKLIEIRNLQEKLADHNPRESLFINLVATRYSAFSDKKLIKLIAQPVEMIRIIHNSIFLSFLAVNSSSNDSYLPLDAKTTQNVTGRNISLPMKMSFHDESDLHQIVHLVGLMNENSRKIPDHKRGFVTMNNEKAVGMLKNYLRNIEEHTYGALPAVGMEHNVFTLPKDSIGL